MKVITNKDTRLPIKTWCENPEAGAIKQATNLANLPFAFRHIALMPDTHQGFGMPIGGVLAAEGVIVPNAVGKDIGCGMCFIESNITEWHENDLLAVKKKVGFEVPTGMGRAHIKPKDANKMPEVTEDGLIHTKLFEPALYQLGTLGGGNHFIELQKDSKGNLCIMIHSGSRNMGSKIADYYEKIAKDINAKYFSKIPLEWGLAFLPLDSEEGQNYIKEMDYCVEFALANRQEMMRAVQNAIYEVFKPRGKVEFSNFINIPHNYARMENHFGKNVMIHRKGSTSAKENQVGLIPGSQGTKSYVVCGLGNRESFESCSHGAGRKMSRAEARKKLDLATEIRRMNANNILHSLKNEIDLDEAPSSYKNIDVVMKEQEDLVKIVNELTPLCPIKGESKERRKRR